MEAVPLVLLADDDADTRDLYVLSFTVDGFAVQVARDGQEAWDKAQVLRPHVVVTDLALPRMDGFALCRCIKADPRTTRTPVVAVSGYTRPGYRDTIEEAGFDAFLLKPVRLEELTALVRRLVQESQLRAASGQSLAAHGADGVESVSRAAEPD